VSVYSCVRVCTRLSLSLSILYMYAYVCVRVFFFFFFFLDLFMSLTFSAYIPTQMEETERYSVPTEEDDDGIFSHEVLCLISDLRCVVVQCCSVVQCVAVCYILGTHRGGRRWNIQSRGSLHDFGSEVCCSAVMQRSAVCCSVLHYWFPQRKTILIHSVTGFSA